MTTTGTDRASALQLAPYIFFYGRCEEALGFYKGVFGGTYELQRNADSPMADEVAPDFRNKVMHAHFTAPGVTFMCSDGRESKTIDPEEGNVSLSLTASDADEGKRVFDALAAGGTVVAPYEDAFWGGKFGFVNDRFGTQWLISGP
ncbi:MAG TPA: VOC family protein [Candidatus Tumulicola sp.]|nr:VOC family protein [Candidatus Tumulicola sp.]